MTRRKSSRQKALSLKAKANEIAERLQKLQANIRKFNKIVKSNPTQTLQTQTELTDVFLDVNADLAIIADLDPEFSQDDFKGQITLMKKYLGQSQSDGQQSVVSKCSNSQRSKSSAHLAAVQIETEQVEAEMQSLQRQADDESKLKELQAQVEAQKLQMKKSRLAEKKQKLQIKQRVLEEHDLDEREDIVDALENLSLAGSACSSQLSMYKTPVKTEMTSKHSVMPGLSPGSNVSDLHVLAESITKAMLTSRMPIAEPPVFTGNPLDYVDWEVLFRTLVESSGISDAHKIHYLN